MTKNIFAKGIKGMKFEDFLNAKKPKDDEPLQLSARESRLIPVGEKDEEMSMTSVFLSGMKYIKEFREMVSEPIKLSKVGQLYCFTEVKFPVLFDGEETQNNRFDGLALVVSGGTIKDAAVFEMKKGKNKLNKEQIERYVSMANKLGIDKLVTITNQYVSKPTDFPIAVNIPKRYIVSLYHYAWKSILYFAQILLKKNNLNIADIDQNNIMYEVFSYLKDCSGVNSFDSMSIPKWKEIVVDLASETLKKDSKDYLQTVVTDWIQEEKDLALKLSIQLSEKEYTPVLCDKKKYSSLEERVKEEAETLQRERKLYSIFRIQNAISPMSILVDFERKMMRASMSLMVPTDKTTAGKVGFIRKYLKRVDFQTVSSEVGEGVYIVLKSKKKKIDDYKISPIGSIVNDPDSINVPRELEFSVAEIIMDHDFGRDLQSSTKFITILEKKVIAFYTTLMQYFEKWTPPTPKAEPKTDVSEDTRVEQVTTEKA